MRLATMQMRAATGADRTADAAALMLKFRAGVMGVGAPQLTFDPRGAAVGVSIKDHRWLQVEAGRGCPSMQTPMLKQSMDTLSKRTEPRTLQPIVELQQLQRQQQQVLAPL